MNKHNTSLIRTCQILDDEKHWKVLHIRMPKFIYIHAYNKFLADFAEMFGSDKNNEKFSNDVLLLEIFNEAYNMIPVIVDNLKRGRTPEGMFEYIRDSYGIQDQDIHIMIESLLGEQKRLVSKYKELKEKDKKEPTEESKNLFSDIIASVEDNLNVTIDRSMSLYMFHSQYKRSLAKIEAFDKLNNK